MNMTLKQLATEIEKLKPVQRSRLLKMLDTPEAPKGRRGGPDDPFSKFIGKYRGSKSGSTTYEEDLYGGDQPL